MTQTLVVANWKENITVDEAQEWVEKLSSKFKVQSSKLEVVVCPSFVVLPMMAYEISKFEGVKLGAQDISKFEEGQHTGEVSAKMLKDFVSYVIVGHSERRRYFNETDEDVISKMGQCLKHNLTPIVCVSKTEEVSAVSNETEQGSDSAKLEPRSGKNGLEKTVFVYEPLEAISAEGEFHPDDPEHVNLMAEKIKMIVGKNTPVLYGGSVNAENVRSFVDQPDIDGVLVGQTSLDAVEFSKIINNSAMSRRFAPSDSDESK